MATKTTTAPGARSFANWGSQISHATHRDGQQTIPGSVILQATRNRTIVLGRDEQGRVGLRIAARNSAHAGGLSPSKSSLNSARSAISTKWHRIESGALATKACATLRLRDCARNRWVRRRKRPCRCHLPAEHRNGSGCLLGLPRTVVRGFVQSILARRSILRSAHEEADLSYGKARLLVADLQRGEGRQARAGSLRAMPRRNQGRLQRAWPGGKPHGTEQMRNNGQCLSRWQQWQRWLYLSSPHGRPRRRKLHPRSIYIYSPSAAC